MPGKQISVSQGDEPIHTHSHHVLLRGTEEPQDGLAVLAADGDGLLHVGSVREFGSAGDIVGILADTYRH